MSMQLLRGKVILLTGGSEGIGLECAKKYLQEGASVGILANDETSLIATSRALSGLDVMLIQADVRREAEVELGIRQLAERYGRLDAIHNNVGIASPSKAVHDTSVGEWDALFDTNVKSIYYTTKHGLAYLTESRGSILNTSSLVGAIGQRLHAAYSATKGAVDALTKSMALDYAEYGIRVNAVAPAAVWTPMLRRWSDEQPFAQTIEKYLDNIHALGYCPQGDVVADACTFLLSDMARFITGCIMPVSGGAELGYRRDYERMDSTV